MKFSTIGLLGLALLATCAWAAPREGVQTPAAAASAAPATPSYGGRRYQIDHVFVMADPALLASRGPQTDDFYWWPQDTAHPGQGTTGGYFYFDNVYIEFLAVTDPDEARANAGRTGVNFDQRGDWRSQQNVSPFGIGLRDTKEGDDGQPDFPGGLDRYDADWMHGEFSLWLTGATRDLTQPWVFLLPFDQTGNPRDWMGPRAARLLEHPGGARVLTDLLLVNPADVPPSETLLALEREGALRLETGDAFRMELTFDGGRQGRTLDLRPQGSPIVLRY